MGKPETTIVTELNEDEFRKFQERRRFDTYRDKAHFYFDKIWQENGMLSREVAYEWLAQMLDISEPKAHFRLMNKQQCKDAIYFCQQILNDNRRCDLDYGVEPITPFYILNP